MTETPAAPPRAEKKPTVFEFHGQRYTDHYEWLRHADEKERLRILRAENEWTAARTAHLAPFVDALVAETVAHAIEDDVTLPYREGDWWYYRRTWAGRQYPALYRVPDRGTRPGFDELDEAGGEQVVWDGNALANGRDFFATSSFRPSPSGTLGALGCDHSGDERFTLRIFDIDRQVVIDDSVENIGYGLSWAADSRSVMFTRLDAAWRSWQVWLHPVGQNGDDHLIYQENDPRFEVSVSQSHDGRWAIIHSSSPTTTEVRLVDRHNPYAPPLLVCPRTRGLDYYVEPAGDQLLVVHNANCKDFEVASAPLRSSGPQEWETILRAGPGERIMWADAFSGYAVVSMRSGGATQMRVIRRVDAQAVADAGDIEGDAGQAPDEAQAHGTSETARTPAPEGAAAWSAPIIVDVPAHATIEIGRHPEWECEEFALACESVLMPPRQLVCDPATGATRVAKDSAFDGFDPARYGATDVLVRAEDGTEIPMTVFHRADIGPNGANPGLVVGYGAYEIANDPYYKPVLLSLLDRGVVLGWTHVRGGGELGRAWYEDGKELNKRNTFTDFVACARYLRESGWTAPGRLAAQGRSAGGLLIGVALNLAPEEFRAAHAGMPFVDALTTICNPNLPLTAGEWEEWGNPLESPEVYEYMKTYTPVGNIRECEYPAILATTSLNDIRVSWVEPTKWVQTLRERATNDPIARPILEKIELVAGHQGASGRYDRWREEAFEYAWLLDQIDANWYV